MDNNKYRPNTSIIKYIISVLTCINTGLHCASGSGGPDREIAGNGNIAPCSAVRPRNPELGRTVCSKEANMTEVEMKITQLYVQIGELLETKMNKIQSLDEELTKKLEPLNNTVIKLERYESLNTQQQKTLELTQRKISNSKGQVLKEKEKVASDIQYQVQMADKKIKQLERQIEGKEKAKIDAIEKAKKSVLKKRECKVITNNSDLEEKVQTLIDQIEELRQVNHAELQEKTNSNLEETIKNLDDEIEELTRQVNKLGKKITQLKLGQTNKIQALDKRTTKKIEKLTNEIDACRYIMRIINSSEMIALIDEMETIANSSEIEELNNQLKTIEELNNQLKTIEEFLEIIANDSEIEELNKQLNTIEDLLDGQERLILIARKKGVIKENLVSKKKMIEEKIEGKKKMIEEKIVSKKEEIGRIMKSKEDEINRIIERKKEEIRKAIIVTVTRKADKDEREIIRCTEFEIKMTNEELKQLERQIEGKKKAKINVTNKAELLLKQIAEELKLMQLMEAKLEKLMRKAIKENI